MRESDLKLEKAVEICRADKLSKRQMKLFGCESSNVNLVKRGGAYRVKNKSDKTQETKKATEGKQENKRNACGNCGLIHTKGQCLAYGKQCNKCKKMNHYARMCRSRKSVNSCQQKPGKSDNYLFLETVKVESVDQIRQSETEYITLSLNKEDKYEEEYEDVFTGIGCLDQPHHIKLDPTVQLVIVPPRRSPFGLEDRMKAALLDMCSQGIIVPVNQPTDWVNAMVVVEKKNMDKLRICIDPRPLNKAIKREHYHLPTIEEITTRLSGAKYFSTLNASSGFGKFL